MRSSSCFLIISNIGCAVVLFPLLKRQNEAIALGYVTARLVECTFILIGILSVLAIVTLRQGASAADAGSLVTVGKSLIAIKNWTFLLGPGFIDGIGTGLMLGWLMYRSGLVPRRVALFGVIGGPMLAASGIAVLFGLFKAGLLRAEHRDDPGVHLGGLPRHLAHIQGVQSGSAERRRNPRCPRRRGISDGRGGCRVVPVDTAQPGARLRPGSDQPRQRESGFTQSWSTTSPSDGRGWGAPWPDREGLKSLYFWSGSDYPQNRNMQEVHEMRLLCSAEPGWQPWRCGLALISGRAIQSRGCRAAFANGWVRWLR